MVVGSNAMERVEVGREARLKEGADAMGCKGAEETVSGWQRAELVAIAMQK